MSNAAEIEARVDHAERVTKPVSNKLTDAEHLYCEAWKGFFRSPNFYFQLAVRCCRAAGLKIEEE